MADAEMKYPIFHMKFFEEEIRKGNNVIANAEDAEMNKPGESSGYLDKPQDSQSLSNKSKGHARKREKSPSVSESSPEKKRPKTSPSKDSQGSVQLVQLRSDLKAKTPSPSLAVTTAPKATSSQGEKATGSKDTASTASDAIPSTSSGSDLFIATSDKEAIDRHGAASSLACKIYKNCLAFGSEILEGNVAWQVNVRFRLIAAPNKSVTICDVGFWTDQKKSSSVENKMVTLHMVAKSNNVLEISSQGHGTPPKIERNLKVGETAIVKIAFAWSDSKQTAFIYIDGENPHKSELHFNEKIKICPIFILGDTVKNRAVIAVNLKVDMEVESSLKSAIEEWAFPKQEGDLEKGRGKRGNTKPK